MADPYALLAATDERVSKGFAQINANAIAGFNAEAEAAKFGFQANMQMAQFREQQKQNELNYDLATQKMALDEKRINQTLAIQKLGAAKTLAQADREFNYRIASEARQNLDSQLDALGTEEDQLRSAAFAGDVTANDRIKEIQNKKTEIRNQMQDVYNRIKGAMDGNDTKSVIKSLRDVDYILRGEEPPQAETPSSTLGNVGNNDGFVPFSEEEAAALDQELLDAQATGGVLPPRQSAARDNGAPAEKTNTLTGSAPYTTEPLANSMINGATASNTDQAKSFFPAAINTATRKAVESFKGFMSGISTKTESDPGRVTSALGDPLTRQPSATPEGGLVKLDPRTENHYRSLVGTNYASVPEAMRPHLLLGKKKAYASLLQAGDPDIKRQYDDLYELGTNPDITESQANMQLEDAVKEGMIEDSTRRSWLNEKIRNTAKKGQAKDPNEDPIKLIDASLQILAKAQDLESSGTPENPKTPIKLGDDFKNSLKQTAQATMARFQLDWQGKNILNQLNDLKTNPTASPDQMRALQIEFLENNQAKGRMAASERLPVLNSQLRSRGVLADTESAVALAKSGQANFVDVISGRLRSTGMNEADSRASANVAYTQYAAMLPYIPTETDSSGAILQAPKPIQIEIGPSRATQNTVVDNTMMGAVRGFFSGPQEDTLTRDARRAEFAQALGDSIGAPQSSEAQQFADMVRGGLGSGDTDMGAQLVSNLSVYRDALGDWSNLRASSNPAYNRTKELASSVADRQTEAIFGTRRPNQTEVNSLKNDIEALGVSGRFDLNERRDYHNALKRVIAIKMLDRLQALRTS